MTQVRLIHHQLLHVLLIQLRQQGVKEFASYFTAIPNQFNISRCHQDNRILSNMLGEPAVVFAILRDSLLPVGAIAAGDFILPPFRLNHAPDLKMIPTLSNIGFILSP